MLPTDGHGFNSAPPGVAQTGHAGNVEWKGGEEGGGGGVAELHPGSRRPEQDVFLSDHAAVAQKEAK